MQCSSLFLIFSYEVLIDIKCFFLPLGREGYCHRNVCRYIFSIEPVIIDLAKKFQSYHGFRYAIVKLWVFNMRLKCPIVSDFLIIKGILFHISGAITPKALEPYRLRVRKS